MLDRPQPPAVFDPRSYVFPRNRPIQSILSEGEALAAGTRRCRGLGPGESAPSSSILIVDDGVAVAIYDAAKLKNGHFARELSPARVSQGSILDTNVHSRVGPYWNPARTRLTGPAASSSSGAAAGSAEHRARRASHHKRIFLVVMNRCQLLVQSEQGVDSKLGGAHRILLGEDHVERHLSELTHKRKIRQPSGTTFGRSSVVRRLKSAEAYGMCEGTTLMMESMICSVWLLIGSAVSSTVPGAPAPPRAFRDRSSQ